MSSLSMEKPSSSSRPDQSDKRLGERSAKKISRVGAGLRNLGNTCFLNAILQCIIHTVPLVERLRASNHPSPCFGDDEGFCTFCDVKDLVYKSIKSSGGVIFPGMFKATLKKYSCDFVAGEQADAHEYLQSLLDRLNTSSIVDNNGIVQEVFGGLLKSQLSCKVCGYRSDRDEPFLDLNLEIDDEVKTLADALNSFTKVETIENFKCQGCRAGASTMEKQIKLNRVPDVLILQLKRFKNDGVSIEKIDKHVDYPKEIDMSPFVCSSQNCDMKYDLYSIVEHTGNFNEGHYVSTVRSSPSSWYRMNDSVVWEISETSALSQKAYILFYIKKGVSPWFSTFVDKTPDKSPESVLPSQNEVPTSSSDRDASPTQPKTTPAVPVKEKVQDGLVVPKPGTAPRSPWLWNLSGALDDEDLPEDKENAHFVSKVQMGDLKRPKKKVEKPSPAPSPPSPSLSPSQRVVAAKRRIMDENLKISLTGSSSKRRSALLDCLPDDNKPSKKPRTNSSPEAKNRIVDENSKSSLRGMGSKRGSALFDNRPSKKPRMNYSPDVFMRFWKK